jgi:hypothetical protein
MLFDIQGQAMLTSMLNRWITCAFVGAAAVSAAGCAGPGAGAPEITVALSGAKEVPPNKSTAAGNARFWVHADRTLNGVVETSGMASTAANLYVGAPGTVGPVVLQLVRTSSEGPVEMEHTNISGASWSVPRGARLDEEHYRAFLAGELYVNVHSDRFREGEIRGQLKP